MGKNSQTDQVIRFVYVHIPFCLKKCNYCSFFSEPFTKESVNKYVEYLLKEIKLFDKNFSIKPKTIYFGGGTPSLLSIEHIKKIIAQFDLKAATEITLECNPASITADFVKELSSSKVNRISLGAQSFQEKELELLSRSHKVDDITNSFKLFRESGFNNISLDLIYGLPYQTKNDLTYSLYKTIDLNPEHISTYCLSLDKKVLLYDLKNKISSDEKIAEFYYLIREKLVLNGFDHYEISNFAKKDYYSNHNYCYWDDSRYLGLGASAAGYIGNIRYQNASKLTEYYNDICKNKIMPNQINLSKEDHEKEYIFLGLRKSEGLDLTKFNKIFKIDFLKKYQIIIQKYKNLLEINDKSIKLKIEAYFISNELFSEFM
ncbi:MAG: radical SAM family heme chaperone HemW [Candidatus Cloacimonetes bacterium]|nr:radical SAM family heme chaperone HemW [Candidatus Cloacimonadota bacterium]